VFARVSRQSCGSERTRVIVRGSYAVKEPSRALRRALPNVARNIRCRARLGGRFDPLPPLIA